MKKENSNAFFKNIISQLSKFENFMIKTYKQYGFFPFLMSMFGVGFIGGALYIFVMVYL